MQKINLFIGLAIIAFLAACSPKMQLGKTEKNLYPISAEMPKDTAILAFYLPYKLKLDSIMNDIVGVSTKELKKGTPEGTLNNFFADAMFDSAKERGIKFDIVYTNLDGLRISLPEGNIYRYKIFELMPFENAFVTVKFKGEDMQSFFDYIAKNGGDPISGARFTIDNKKAIDITIDGKPFDVNRNYVVLTSDYMVNGGDGGVIFNKNMERKDLDYKLRDSILDYLAKLKKEGKQLNPVIDGRIKIK